MISENELKSLILDRLFKEIQDLEIQVHPGKNPPTLTTKFTSSNPKPASDGGWKAHHIFEKCISVGEDWLTSNLPK